MGLDDFLKKWDNENWQNLESLQPKRSAPSTSSASTKAKVQRTVEAGKDAKAGVPAPVTPPEALEAWRRQREERAQPASAKEETVKKAPAKEDLKEEVKSEEPDSSDSNSSGFDESEESEGAKPEPKVSKRQMELHFFGYKRRGGGRKKRQTRQNKEQRLARLARQGK